MPLDKKLSKLSNVDKKKLLGVFLIVSFVALAASFATYYLLKAKVDLRKTTVIILSIGGILAVYIEMRGKLGKKASKLKTKLKTKIKTRSKTKSRKRKK